MDRLDPLYMRPGPSAVLRVRCYGPCLTFGRSWSGAPAAVQLAPGPASNGGVLAHPTVPGLCAAPTPWPIGTKTGCMASFN